MQNENECNCPSNSYEDFISSTCPTCANKCQECVDDANKCLICKGNRINEPNCTCPAGQYEDYISENC